MEYVPQGWYADPNGQSEKRWWDGRQWTDFVYPPLTSATGVSVLPPPPSASVPALPPTEREIANLELRESLEGLHGSFQSGIRFRLIMLGITVAVVTVIGVVAVIVFLLKGAVSGY